MNAPAPAPKDPLRTLLLLGAFACASIAFIKLDQVLNDLTGRISRLETSAPVAKVAGEAFAEQLIPEDTPPARRSRPRVVKSDD